MDLIKPAHAYIAVIASDNPGHVYSKATKPWKDWQENVTMVLDRRGDKLTRIFEKVFTGMLAVARGVRTEFFVR